MGCDWWVEPDCLLQWMSRKWIEEWFPEDSRGLRGLRGFKRVQGVNLNALLKGEEIGFPIIKAFRPVWSASTGAFRWEVLWPHGLCLVLINYYDLHSK